MAEAQGLKPISFHPDDAVSGGLINDVDVEVESSEFTVDGPEGYTESSLFLKWSLKDLQSGEVTDQWWSAGKQAYENFTPSDDGRFLLPTGGKDHLIKDSNFMLLMESLTGKGYPKNLCSDAGAMRGLQLHVVRVPLKARPGMSAPNTDRERTVLVCERIIRLPGEKTRGKGAAAPAAGKAKPVAAASPAAESPAPAVAAEANGEVSELAADALRKVLEANSNTLELKQVRAQVFRALQSKTVAERNEAIKLVTDADWLTNQGFLVDDKTVSL